MLVVVYVGANFEILVTDLTSWWPIIYFEKVTNMKKKVTNMTVAVDDLLILDNFQKLAWLNGHGKHHIFNFQIKFDLHDISTGSKFILNSLLIRSDSFLNLIS